MSIDIEKIKDEIDYHIQCMDEKGQFPNVWINMIYLSHLNATLNSSFMLKCGIHIKNKPYLSC